MIFREAKAEDLPQIKDMFIEIIDDMNANGIEIWDEIYPCSYFAKDVEQGRLCVLCDGETIVSALVLADGKDEGEGNIVWKKPSSNALYILRFGVNVRYRNRGLGQRTIKQAAEFAKKRGANSLRLLVVDCNTPARKLYEKCGFALCPGDAVLNFDDGTTLRELGMELQV